MNYIIEFSDGCHGILPNDNMEYSVSRGRVILYKDGEKILDKEIIDCPSGKCEISLNDDTPDVKAIPVDGEVINKDVDVKDHDIDKEYNIGNMLPQGMGTGVSDVLSKPLMTAEDTTESTDDTSDEDVITEVGVGGALAIGGASIAALWGVLGGGFFKLGEMGVDKIVQTSKRPKYKKILDAYYDYFMVNKAPKFSSLKKRKYFAKETGDERNPILGFLKKYGGGKEIAVVDYFYEDKSVCGCYMEKKYKAAFDWFTIVINGGDVVKFDYGWTKHIQPKVFEYNKFSNYYIAYMDLMLGFTDTHFMDVIRDIKFEIKKHENEIKSLKKESVDVVDDINMHLTLNDDAISYINCGNNNLTESAKDVVINFETDANVSRKLRVIIVETALMQARLEVLKKKDSKSPKIAELKRDIIAKEKDKRALLEGQTQEVKDAVKRIEKVAVAEAKKEVSKEEDIKEESVVDVVPLVEENGNTEEEPLSIKVLRDKIALNEERLKNANKEPKKHASLINALTKENEEYKDRIDLLKSKLGKEPIDKVESVEDLESDEVITEIAAEAIVFGASALATLAIFSIPAAINAYQKYKKEKRYNAEVDAMRCYPIKHPDAPKLSQISRKKFEVSAYDGKRGKSVPDNDNYAKGIFEYVYYYKKKEIVIVQQYGNQLASGVCKDLPAKIKDHKEYVYAMILLYKHNWITPNIKKFLDKEIEENKKLRKMYNGKLVPDTKNKIKVESDMANLVDSLGAIVNETANIDDAIKDTIATLNSKGYITRYSSAGHYHLRKKEDREPDGVYHGKLYSDARVQFKGTYHFGAAPKYWFWKKVDGDDYLDIIPIAYDDKDGTPDEAFTKWRDNYLGTLARWADALPSAKEKKEDDPTPEDKNIKEESARISELLDRTFDDIFRENGLR